MSVSEKSNTLVYSYESSVHSTSVLLSLNDQRKQDLFCDVTVVVENKSFRAHRSVLAACSDYFLSTVAWKKDLDMLVTLPEEVTVKGFAPLLQFAYTAKLLLNKENVLDVCRSVEFLGIHNIEKSCFSFLQARLFGKGRDHAGFPRKACCTSSCQKTNLKIPVGDNENSEADDDVEEFLESENPKSPCPKLRKCIEVGKICPKVQSEASEVKYSCLKQSGWASSSLCPKYRKFQLACGKERLTSWGNTLSLPNSSLEQILSKQQIESCQSLTFPLESEDERANFIEKDSDSTSMEGEGGVCDEGNIEMKKQMNARCPLAQDSTIEETQGPSSQNISGIQLSCTGEHYDLPCSQAEPFIPLMLQYENLQTNSAPPANIEETKIEVSRGCDQPNASERAGGDSERKSVIFSSGYSKRQENPIAVSSGRSIVEREVAEHLAKGFWSELCGAPSSCEAESFIKEKSCPGQFNLDRISQCPQFSTESCQTLEGSSQSSFLLHYTSSSSNLPESTYSSLKCPFAYDTGNSVCSSSSGIEELESDQGQQQDKYDTCTTNSGDEFGSESEDDSESCSAREQECEVKLPFPVERITLLSRNDFQTMLKLHKLNPEQLDYIHDVRRRSKNRIAAQRCRKRKLDCIQNLECEIHKLLCEKEKLLQEKGQLKVCMGQTWDNLSVLCKQVCKEAALTAEQIQTLAKYSSPECPLSMLNTQRSIGSITCTNLISSYPGYTAAAQSTEFNSEQSCTVQLQEKTIDALNSPQESITADQPGMEQCCQAVMTDFCQEMIEKCTTDE
ncbi:transcription regulator protein BACH1-like isoform X2 [Carcharodon carcharias]|uniref:transcription regulator protein BACH1-like isoform X2 n=1 Tax=Carcharodon carcharias TaxID=13397 RepID=UPI001B7F575A|nr:transcription regulator protein BACH1-like isoform X2 [Carcharodon carcharias]